MTAAPISTAPEALRAQLRACGLRVTAPRLAVLSALAHEAHADADTIFRAVRTDLPGTSLQAVYGVLGALTEAGILRRIEPASSAALYERRVGDNHHHLICTSCRTVHDVDCVVGEAPCLTPSDAHGFDLGEAEVTFWGLCPACRPASDNTVPPIAEETLP